MDRPRPEPLASSTWGRKLTRLATGALAIGTLESCDADSLKPEPPVIEVGVDKEPLAAVHSGDWQMESRVIGSVHIDAKHGKTLYHFLQGTFESRDWFAPLPQEDKLAVIDGYIRMIREKNPGVNIDKWEEINGKDLQFPVEVEIIPRPDKLISKKDGGYSRMQELAEADGFPVRAAGAQPHIYEQAMKQTVELPSSPFYYRDHAGSEDSPARLEPDVLDRLVAMGQDFTSRTFGGKKGWRFSLTDLMRDPKAQAKRHKGEANAVEGTTHSTGRTFDLSDGRFIDPNGELVTWSIFDEHGKGKGPSLFAPMIEKEMRPALVELAMEHGFLPYIEGSHWHTYAPRERHANLRDLLVVSRAEEPTEVKPVTPATSESEVHTQIMQRLREEAAPRSLDTRAEVETALTTLAPYVDLAFYKDITKPITHQTDKYLSLLMFPPLGAEHAKYAAMPLTTVGEKLRATIEHDESEDARQRARIILQGRLHQEMIEIVRRMSPDDIIRHRVFLGMTIDSPKKHSFANLDGVWNFKITDPRVTSKAVKEYGPHTRKQLVGKERSITMATWLEKQQAANDLFARHADDLGYQADVVKYITPEVMLAVIHAEFFSELDAETFIKLSPILFETYNIAYGPAVNDHLYSGGLVQMTSDTFTEILNKHGDALRKIKENDPTATFIIPKKLKKETSRTITIGRGKKAKKRTITETVEYYDPSEFAKAMLTDIDSQLFYNSFVVTNNMRRAIDVLRADEDVREAWMRADDADRYRFMAALSPMAINNPAAARRAAGTLANDGRASLRSMADRLDTLTTLNTASRGAERGFATMDYLLTSENTTAVASSD